MPDRVSLVASAMLITRVHVSRTFDSFISLRNSRNMIGQMVDIRQENSSDSDIHRVVDLVEGDEVLLPDTSVEELNHHTSEDLGDLVFFSL